MKNNSCRNYNRRPAPSRKCAVCGKVLKKKTRTNYPFGRKSKGVVTSSYDCAGCGSHTN